MPEVLLVTYGSFAASPMRPSMSAPVTKPRNTQVWQPACAGAFGKHFNGVTGVSLIRVSQTTLLLSFSVAAVALAPAFVLAQAQSPPRIANLVDTHALKRIAQSTHPLATSSHDAGRVEPSLPMQRMLLVLARSDQQETELKALITAQKVAGAPGYHLGLTPEQFAERFGPNEADLQQVKTWLAVQGFRVDAVARGHQWIEFSGNAHQVEAAFHTQMHRYTVGNKSHVANASDLLIPEALAPVVSGVLSLNDFGKHPLSSPAQRVQRDPVSGRLAPTPDLTTAGGNHHLAPADVAKIYDTVPLLNTGTTGSGVSVAIAGRTSIQLSDVQAFRQIFALPPNDPVIINNGPAPQGDANDEVESDLDVQWAGALAPDATIKFVTSASTFATDGIDLSNAYIIDNKVAPIMSVSYGLCEPFFGAAGNAFYAALFQQAAVEGITVFVSSGDNGAAGCDPPESNGPAQNGLAVNGLASTPYNIAVGGTQLNEGGNDAAYWNASNNPDQSSVLGYIPESVWNETCDPVATPDLCSFYNLWSGSGGASSIYAKPSWQAGTGVPTDAARDVPDLSLTAAGGHDGYLICYQGSCVTHVDNGVTILDSATVIGGTSASSPAMAGIMALVEQKNGTYLGLANDDFYKIAASDKLAKCDSSKLADPAVATGCVFHDVTEGDNSVPGLAGYTAKRGYDLASGLGSVDAANLANAWNSNPPRASVTTLSSPAPTIQHGQPFPLSVAVAPAAGIGIPSGFFALETDLYGAYLGDALTNGAFNGNVSNLPGGQYNLTAHYAGDTVFAGSDSSPLSVTILPEDSSVSIDCITLNFAGFVVNCFGFETYGQPTALTFAVNGLSGQGAATGTIQVNLDGAPLATIPVQQGKAGLEIDGLPEATGLLPGDHTFTASYSGDNSFNASTSAAYPTTITTTQVFSSVTTTDDSGVAEIGANTQLPLVIRIGAPGVLYASGTVQLVNKDTGELIGPELVLDALGQASESILFATPGLYDVCANYGGDAIFDPIECQFTHGNAAGISITVDAPPDSIFNNGFDGP